jgi:hypothetical protein
MSMHASSTRPAAKSIGAAFVDVVLTLVILVVVFLTFLIAPLVALALAYLAYAVIRPRGKKKPVARPGQSGSPGQPRSPGQSGQAAAYGFGAGTS